MSSTDEQGLQAKTDTPSGEELTSELLAEFHEANRDNELFASTEDPEFEFDESGLQLASKEAELDLEAELEGITEDYNVPMTSWEEDLAREQAGEIAFRSGAITPEGLIEDDFEKELGTPSDAEDNDESEFRDVAQYRILEVAGDDTYGRKVIVASACRLPPSSQINHERLMEYLKYTLDQYVENDYVIVYFHYGLTSKNKPKLGWMLQMYRELDRKYKKNLKALYLVHPTNFIKLLLNIFKPFISAKFGRKIMYVDYLHKLKEHLHFDQLVVPSLVLEHDAKILAAQKPSYPYSSDESEAAVHNPKQQFGVKLQQILQNYKCVIPPVVEICVEFLRKNALDVEGIFRRSANASVLKDVQKRFNQGETVDFDEINDVHIPAVTMKTFLRDLQEPILTFDLYQPVVRLHTLEEDRQLIEVQRLFREELPKENYIILKYIIHFLTQVSQYSDSNKMNTLNLAIVFGPNLLWPKGQANLSTIGHLNSFAAYLIDNYTQLFVR